MARRKAVAWEWTNEPHNAMLKGSQHYAINLSIYQCIRWFGNQ